jgi:hypothetical protein
MPGAESVHDPERGGEGASSSMIVMLDTSRQSWDAARAELGTEINQLFTPLTRYHPHEPDMPFAIDNGAFSGFDAKAFRSLLAREYERRHLCRFVAVPDVVGSAMRTFELFRHFSYELRDWPLAYVCQDGQESVEIPWAEIRAIFIGGTDRFKDSAETIACIKAAKILGKWVHVGRVNSPRRFEHFESLGVDSVDGTGLARYTHMREKVRHRHDQIKLYDVVP